MVKYGLVLYSVESDGALNGVYTNEGAHGVIYNEIVRKEIDDKNRDAVEGNYTCSWIDEDNEQIEGTLRITPRVGDPRILDFQWSDNSAINPVFIGIGYRMNPRQIAVYYHSAALTGHHVIPSIA